MISEQDKYQNILAQMHELNRQNLLNENERNEEISSKIEYLTQLIETNKQGKEKFKNLDLYKLLYILIAAIGVNLLLTIFILFGVFSKNETQKENIVQDHVQVQNSQGLLQKSEIQEDIQIEQEEDKIENLPKDENIQENAVTFEQEPLKEKDETFEEMKPIIKKDTIYSCEDDNYTKIYKIPYTVEIKGKLYQDRFIFILQNDSGTRKCMINKNDM
ncbi:hypothetical protein [Halarcobacter anaerophilus]|uniref:Transmembrane protein n=1 Tax=Halarcobacter anaerophilus TaxID=877500 RepID=A0A4V1LQ27_9BACT|nr:hypothetical protein [Halarcobacter anaerophilus]QDF28508.1 hypothetical protein AANAER_1022 [Halarcobacter anaerophilus]RXJ63238.1 hypothetical protein CRV06_06045 [Halarcobacter anaerophilus]